MSFNPESKFDWRERYIQANSVPDHSLCDKVPCSACENRKKRKPKKAPKSWEPPAAGLAEASVCGWAAIHCCSFGAKTVRNRFATFRLMWQQAKAWLYVAHEACQGVRLPEWEKKEQPHFLS